MCRKIKGVQLFIEAKILISLAGHLTSKPPLAPPCQGESGTSASSSNYSSPDKGRSSLATKMLL